MFSRLLRVSVPFSSSPPSSPFSTSSSNFSPGRQLRAELSQAVDRGMVSTRSQDHTPAGDVDLKDLGSNRSSGAKTGKRKAQIDDDAVTPSQPASKRRRAISKLKSDVASTTESTVPEESRQREHDEGDTMVPQDLAASEQDNRLQKATRTPSPASVSSPRQSLQDSNGPDVIKSSSIDPQHGNGPEEVISARATEADPPPVAPQKAKQQRKLKRTPNGPANDTTEPENSYGTLSGEAKIRLASAKPPTATHKRFDSEEPDIPEPQEAMPPENATSNEITTSDDDDDDDQPPETLTASAALTQARTAALEEAKAAAKQDEKRKLKRRERDARLKMQATKAGKKHATKLNTPNLKIAVVDDLAEAEDDDDAAASGQNTTERSSKARRSLPAFLPDHILADEPDEIRLLALPQASSSTKALVNTKRKFLDIDAKPSKDLKRGNVKVRVLPKESGFLAPKASQRGKTLREAWLMGRGLQRRKTDGGGGGFVRR